MSRLAVLLVGFLAVGTFGYRDGGAILGHRQPFLGGRKARPAPPAQIILTHPQAHRARRKLPHHLGQGAVPSDTVYEILLRNGIKHKYAEEKVARQAKACKLAHAKGKLFTKTERVVAEKKKAAEEAAAAAEEYEEAIRFRDAGRALDRTLAALATAARATREDVLALIEGDEHGVAVHLVGVVGRGKDLIITGGYNVYPKEVELAIDELPGVAESAVVGVPHPDFGEAVTAVVVARPGVAAPTEAEVIAWLKSRLANFKVPKRVVFAVDLPRNSMGKVVKAELREKFAR